MLIIVMQWAVMQEIQGCW